MMKMLDNVPKLPMTYRVSPDSCIVIVIVVVVVEYLPTSKGVLNYCNFRRYSRCIVFLLREMSLVLSVSLKEAM